MLSHKKEDIKTIRQKARHRREEISRALAADRTMVESLDAIILSLKESIDKNQHEKAELIDEIYNIDTTKENKEKELESILNKLSSAYSELNNSKEKISEYNDKIKKELTDFNILKEKLHNDFEEDCVVLDNIIQDKRKEIVDLSNNILELVEKEKDLKPIVKEKLDYISILNKNIEIKNILLDKIRNEVEGFDKRKETAERDTKVCEQKLLEKQKELKELRRK